MKAETEWDVTASGENPYTMSFTGTGEVTLTSDVELEYESEVTDTIDIEKTPIVSFRAASAPRVIVTEEKTGRSVALIFGTGVTEEKETTEEPNVKPEEPVVEELPVVKEEAPQVKEKTKPSNKATTTVKSAVDPTGWIEGTVWYDENEDGIRQVTEPLLDDVNVFLMNSNYDVMEAAITSEGRYAFKPVVPGKYLVKIDGYEIGLYTFSKRNQGNDRSLDSDVDQYGGYPVAMKDETVVVDAGMIEGNEDMAESHFLTVTNFIDANQNQLPEMDEKSVRATYSLLDTVTGEVLPAETVEAEEALTREIPLGTYILKVELPAGYSARAIHQANYDSPESEDGSVTEKYERFVKGLERTRTDAILDLTQNRQGTTVVVEVEAIKPTVKPKPVEQPKPVKVTETIDESPAQVKAVQSKTTATAPSAERLPQAGEEKPFPYATIGTGLAVAGLWLLMRRSV
ncbi:SdrD B-like domain-containing protein [Exiguobacterium undae]